MASKQKIFEQLVPLYDDTSCKEIPIWFEANDIPDELVEEWNAHHNVIQKRFQHERRTRAEILAINDALIRKMMC